MTSLSDGVSHAQLTDTDLAVLADIADFRLLSSRHVQQLHFAGERSTVAAARACNRALNRLRSQGLTNTLERRIGGVRRGSAGLAWYLTSAGYRLVSTHRGETPRRRRLGEPSRHFVTHTLAIADLAVEIAVAARVGEFELVRVETEPDNWQTSLTAAGVATWLKPDLRLVLAAGEFEQHWFVEVDLATEHLPVVRRQCDAYRTHERSGRYQAAHNVYPAVLWVVPTTRRAEAVRRATSGSPGDDQRFQVCSRDQALTVLTAAADAA